MQPSATLTTDVLNPELRAHGEQVLAHLRNQVSAADGFLGFDAFMHEALYAPGLGYYASGLRKFGAEGDFTTAPEISPLFGRVLARQIAEVHDALGVNEVVEFGPGTGALAEAILGWFQEHDRPVRYTLVEVGPGLAERQRARLSDQLTDERLHVTWANDLGELRCRGAIIANEVMDALPVVRFKVTADGVREIGIAVDDDKLIEAQRPAREAIVAAVRALNIPLPEGFVSELCLALPGWLQGLSDMLDSGVVLLSDYGYSRSDYYAAERDAGTLMCHFRHQAHSDYLFAPGLQDLTAWVDFTAVAEASDAAGLVFAGYTNQASFLLGGGLSEELAATEANTGEMLRQSAAIKTLTLPGEMGERFRFMALSRGTLPLLSGFSMKDLSYTL